MNTEKERFLAAIGRLARDPQPVHIELSKFDLWCLLSAVQLACRHPSFTGPSRQVVEGTARTIGDALTANDLDLRLCFAAGWESSFDVES